MSIKAIVKPFIPVGIFGIKERRWHAAIRAQDANRRQKLAGLRSCVSEAVRAIRDLTPADCRDVEFLEAKFIPSLGLNDEMLHQQPTELSEHFGKGLHIWQYPSQLARYLVWLSENGQEVRCYMEIGCRWGGMLILVTEWLRKAGADIQTIVAVDPIEPSPFIGEYFGLLKSETASSGKRIDAIYVKDFSTSATVKRLVERVKPDMVFIDGDHQLRGALYDHLLIRDYANMVVHHDINSLATPDTTFLWRALKEFERKHYKFIEFVDQYDSVNGNFLGIGVMKRTSQQSVESGEHLPAERNEILRARLTS